MKKITVLSFLFFANIAHSFAATANADSILQKIVVEIFSPIYQAVVAVAFVYFLYGAAKYIYYLRNPSEKNEGKNHLLWGMVGLFIIISVGGILQLFGEMFGGGAFIY